MKGTCPKCNAEVDMYSTSCPECNYEFGQHRRSPLIRKLLLAVVVLLTAAAFYIYFSNRIHVITDYFS